MAQYFMRIGIALTVLLNVILGGYSNQSFSARNYAWKKAGKPNLVWLIDGIWNSIGWVSTHIFRKKIDLSDHCMHMWIYWRVRKDVVYDIQNEVIKENYYGEAEGWKIERLYLTRKAFQRFSWYTHRNEESSD